MFTTPCFIRKNTPELRKKLEYLGYYPHPSANLENSPTSQVLYTGRGFYGIIPIGYSEEINRIVNCGNNEELFLAIAALRDDSDEEQYFTNGKEWRKLSKNIPWQQDSFTIECHKATVEELIKHFNHG